MEKLLICKVGRSDYYGNEYEYKAARLNAGDRVIFQGAVQTVKYVWFYDGPIVVSESGTSIHPELGDTFEVLS